MGRAPRILVHDSHLFDAIDGRQVASCLNVGARLAEEIGFQYNVTLSSDFLALVESQSDGAFDAHTSLRHASLMRPTTEASSASALGSPTSSAARSDCLISRSRGHPAAMMSVWSICLESGLLAIGASRMNQFNS